MNNLLFYALLAALAWYFFYYLPAQPKPSRPDPFKPTTSTSTQTDFTKSPSRSGASLTDPEPEPIIHFPSDQPLLDCPITGPSAVKTPSSYPYSETERTELEQTLDFLIKEMKDLDKVLEDSVSAKH